MRKNSTRKPAKNSHKNNTIAPNTAVFRLNTGSTTTWAGVKVITNVGVGTDTILLIEAGVFTGNSRSMGGTGANVAVMVISPAALNVGDNWEVAEAAGGVKFSGVAVAVAVGVGEKSDCA